MASPSLAVTITQSTKNLKISDELFITSTGENEKIEDIVDLGENSFSKYGGKSLGFRKEIIWGKYKVTNKSEIEEWFITLYVSHIGKIKFYKVSGSQIDPVESMGRDLNTTLRKISLKNPTIPIQIDQNFDGYIYFRAQSENNLTFDLDLRNMDSLLNLVYRDTMFQGLYYGFLFALILYVFTLWVFASESIYGRYGVYLLAMGLFQICTTHDGSTFIWPGYIKLDKFMEPFSAGLVLISMGWFLKGFFKRSIKKSFSFIPSFTMLVGLTVSFLPIINGNYRINLLSAMAAGLLTFPIIAFYLYRAWRSGIKTALLMCIGWVFMTIGMYYQVLMKFGFFPYIYNFFQMTCIVDFTLLTASISLRVKEINENFLDQKRRHEISKSIAITTEAIVHEVKSPFRVICNVFDEISSIADTNNEFVSSLLARSKQKLDEVGELLKDILAIGKPDINKEKCSILELIGESIELSGAKNLIIEGDDFGIIADKPKTKRLFSNLLLNADKNSPNKNKPVLVKLDQLTKKTLTFTNYGVHLPKGELSKIFEPFYSKGGTGLGLYLSKSIVDAHNWQISCHSCESGNFVAMKLTFD